MVKINQSKSLDSISKEGWETGGTKLMMKINAMENKIS